MNRTILSVFAVLAFVALAATVVFWTWQVVEHLAR